MHLLETILQLNVATDQAALTHLPFVVSILTPEAFKSSSSIPKWVARINSLLTSKHTGARWAGLCLALQTGVLNKDILKECSQNWISICLPLLSRNEDIPNLKASIRLLDYIFFVAHDISEFQRQLATPNVPKYSAALLSLAERTEIPELQKSCLESLARLIPIYPTLHRQLQSNLSTFCFALLSGKPAGSDPTIIERSCDVLSVLHLTSGKVASTTSWRKVLDTSIVNAWFALSCVRNTFPQLESHKIRTTQPTFKPPPSDPLVAIPLSLDRLKSVICLIIHLIKAPVYRPTTVCIGELVDLVLALLRSSSHTEESLSETQRHALEASVVPDIWSVGCDLLSQMAASFKYHINPNISRILSCVVHNLEQPSNKSHRLIFLRSLETVFSHVYTFHSVVMLNRIVRHLLSQIAVLLPQKLVTSSRTEEASGTSSKRSRKRARGFDGDEVFQVSATVACANYDEEEIVLLSLNVLDLLLSNPLLSSSLRILSARILTNALFELSRSPAASLSRNPNFHGSVYNKILIASRKQIGSGTAGWLNSGMGLIISSLDKSNIAERDDTASEPSPDGHTQLNFLLQVLQCINESRQEFDMILHPRLPPPLRSNPPVEAISLFHSEHEVDDKVNRDAIGLSATEELQVTTVITGNASSSQKDQQQAPVSPSQVKLSQSAQAINPPIQLAMSAPKLQPRSDFVLPIGQFPDTPVNHEATGLRVVVSPQLERQKVDTTLLAQTQNPLGTAAKLTQPTLNSSIPASPQSQELQKQFAQKTRHAEPADSDMDDEGIPEIDLESDSD